MSRATELLEQATPLPWESNDFENVDYLGTYRTIRGPEWSVADRIGLSEDAALIVYAVNRLPAYEAAVEVLDRIIHHFNRDAIDDGILVLDRLREGEAAHVG